MSDNKVIKVLTKERGEELGDLFGIFFEDLNHAADGGLYAELVQNRSFEFDPIDHKDYHALTAWEKVERGNAKAEIFVENKNPLNEKNINYLTLAVEEPGTGAGFMNLGFNTGIPVREELETPEKIIPKQHEITVKGNTIDYEFPKQSITIMRFN